MKAILFAIALACIARPGGGQSFSGGGGGGGGFGGGGGGGGGGGFSYSGGSNTSYSGSGNNDLGGGIFIALVLGLLVVTTVARKLRSRDQGWETGIVEAPEPSRSVVARTALEELRPIDPEFSNVLFEDFVYMLYAEIQRARAKGFDSIGAFVSPDVALWLRDKNLTDVNGVIVGAMRIVEFTGLQFQKVQIELEIESNYAEIDTAGKEHRYWALDRMTLGRFKSAKSRPPKRARTLDCPNCGAPLSSIRGTQCSYCNKDVGAGRFDWHVEAFRNVSKESRGPLLTSNVEEVGTDFPTIIAPGAERRLDDIVKRDPTFGWNAFQTRVNAIFNALQDGWSNREPLKIRPFVTDNLFQSMMYWIDLYVKQRCRNMNDGARMTEMVLANVLSDPHYDAITVRVYGIGADYTISDDGKILSGSKKQRRYSEYWTLVRGVKHGEAKDPLACPNCGAPMKISMVGNCDHCGVKVTSGEFDWVLSRIEQDEVYTG